MVTRDDLVLARPDGNRIFMVVFELSTLLFALVFAFPHIPTAVVDETGRRNEFKWTSVADSEGLRNAIRDLLRTSDILEACRGATAIGDELEAVCDHRTLSTFYHLNLLAEEVPLTTRQMVEAVCRVYQKLATLELRTREEVIALLRHHQFIQNNTRLRPGANINRSQSALLTFCMELSVEWIQPFFARNVRFYIPPGLVPDSYTGVPAPLRAMLQRGTGEGGFGGA